MANKKTLNNLLKGKGRLPMDGEDDDGLTSANSSNSFDIDLDEEIDIDDDTREITENDRSPLDITIDDINKAASSKDLNLQINNDKNSESFPEVIDFNTEQLSKDYIEDQESDAESDNEIEKLRKESKQLKEQLANKDDEINEIDELHSKQINDLNHQYKEKIEQLNEEIKNQSINYTNKLEEFSKQYDLEITELQNQIIQLSTNKSEDSNLEDELKKKNNEIKQLNLKSKELELQLKSKDEEYEELNDELSSIRKKFSALITNNDKNKEKIKELEKEISILESNPIELSNEELEIKLKEVIEENNKSWEKKLKSKLTDAQNGSYELSKGKNDIINYVCELTLINLNEKYNSEIFTKDYVSDLFNKFIQGEITSKDTFFQALIKEILNKDVKDEYLNDKTNIVLEYLVSEEVILK